MLYTTIAHHLHHLKRVFILCTYFLSCFFLLFQLFLTFRFFFFFVFVAVFNHVLDTLYRYVHRIFSTHKKITTHSIYRLPNISVFYIEYVLDKRFLEQFSIDVHDLITFTTNFSSFFICAIENKYS